MKTNLDNITVEDLVPELVNETIDINSLNYMKKVHRDAFVRAIGQRHNLLQKVKGNPYSKYFLSLAVKTDYRNFIYLKREQYTDETAQIYLDKRLAEKESAESAKTLTSQKSLDNKLMFVFSYVTPEGDELYYYDRELQVPASVKSSLKMSFKVVDGVKFIDKLDTHITQLGAIKIRSTLTDIISSNYRTFLNEYIATNNIGYYSLCSNLSTVEANIKKRMNETFADYGIELSELIIKKLAIPKEIQYKLEDQAFQIRKKRAEIEADSEFSKKSLESYAAKLAIQEKFPNAQHTLTEYEKDLALKRYLIKTKRAQEEKIDHTIEIKKAKVNKDEELKKVEDVAPEAPAPKNTFKIVYFTMLAICVLASLLTFIGSIGIGLILLGVTALVFGMIAAFKNEKFKKVEMEKELPEEKR